MIQARHRPLGLALALLALLGAVLALGPGTGTALAQSNPAPTGITFYFVDDTTNALYVYNTDTGAGEPVGDSNVLTAFGVGETEPRGLAACGDAMYMVGDANNALYRISPYNGAAARVGTAVDFGVGLKNPGDMLDCRNETLYLANRVVSGVAGEAEYSFYQLDKDTGVASLAAGWLSTGNGYTTGDSDYQWDEGITTLAWTNLTSGEFLHGRLDENFASTTTSGYWYDAQCRGQYGNVFHYMQAIRMKFDSTSTVQNAITGKFRDYFFSIGGNYLPNPYFTQYSGRYYFLGWGDLYSGSSTVGPSGTTTYCVYPTTANRPSVHTLAAGNVKPTDYGCSCTSVTGFLAFNKTETPPAGDPSLTGGGGDGGDDGGDDGTGDGGGGTGGGGVAIEAPIGGDVSLADGELNPLTDPVIYTTQRPRISHHDINQDERDPNVADVVLYWDGFNTAQGYQLEIDGAEELVELDTPITEYTVDDRDKTAEQGYMRLRLRSKITAPDSDGLVVSSEGQVFEIPAGETRYSQWSRVYTVPMSGAGTAAIDTGQGDARITLSSEPDSAAQELRTHISNTFGLDPQSGASAAIPFLLCLVLACIAAACFFGPLGVTPMSIMLAAGAFTAVWSGLGPIFFGVSLATAILFPALLCVAGIMLVKARGVAG